MSSEKFDFLVFIGRFQPFHAGHLHVVQQALQSAERLIILCGSAHQARQTRNPWTVAEREQMIRLCFNAADNSRIDIVPLMDSCYNDAKWVQNVQSTVSGLVCAHHQQPHRSARVGLIGHNKDQTSYYLNLFPQWGSVAVDNYRDISATLIRELLFNHSSQDERDLIAQLDHLLPAAVLQYLHPWLRSDTFIDLQQEYQFIQRYQSAWAKAPYPPTFVTVDAVVVQSGHILLIERKARPGKDLWALPGGFVDQNETLMDACLRELREETRLKIPAPVLKGSIVQQHVYDEPHRSARGRTITHAFHIDLAPNAQLPPVKGGDDAKAAHWVPLANLQPAQLFEDHYFIIQHMLGA